MENDFPTDDDNENKSYFSVRNIILGTFSLVVLGAVVMYLTGMFSSRMQAGVPEKEEAHTSVTNSLEIHSVTNSLEAPAKPDPFIFFRKNNIYIIDASNSSVKFLKKEYDIDTKRRANPQFELSHDKKYVYYRIDSNNAILRRIEIADGAVVDIQLDSVFDVQFCLDHAKPDNIFYNYERPDRICNVDRNSCSSKLFNPTKCLPSDVPILIKTSDNAIYYQCEVENKTDDGKAQHGIFMKYLDDSQADIQMFVVDPLKRVQISPDDKYIIVSEPHASKFIIYEYFAQGNGKDVDIYDFMNYSAVHNCSFSSDSKFINIVVSSDGVYDAFYLIRIDIEKLFLDASRFLTRSCAGIHIPLNN